MQNTTTANTMQNTTTANTMQNIFADNYDSFVWEDVPANWEHDYAPDVAKKYEFIKMRLRTGEVRIGCWNSFGKSWDQRNNADNVVVQFRKFVFPN